VSHYRSNLRDIEFNLFEANRTQDHLGTGPFRQMDEQTARAILDEVDRLARNEWAASFEEADRIPLELQDGEVALPEGLKRSLDAFYDGGWDRLPLPERLGGFGAPPSLNWATSELLAGGNATALFYTAGTLMAYVLDQVATREQVARYVEPMIERRWGGTMVLTEPDAGSDVGAGVTKATHVEGDLYHLEGVKRFITSGEYDHTENIIHLVLARPEGAEPGTKGLSMFIVPKYQVNDDGSIGERNGVVCTNIERRMGIKGSATCELTFGADRPCVGELVGGVHLGIKQMFKVIEYARMLVGTKAAATLSTGYLNALAYAKERVQGPDLTRAADKTAPKVRIIEHPDVRRMLMAQKAHAEGLRALVLYTAWIQDQARLDPDDADWFRRDDLLLPLVKGYSSEKSYEQLAQCLQVFGGSGYCQDYPLEQYIRDAKIDTVYEGTTTIQSLDLFFRKIVKDHGATLNWFVQQIRESAKAGENGDAFRAEREALGKALDDAQAQVGAVVGHLVGAQEDIRSIYKVGLSTNAVLETLAEVVIGWLLLRHAEVAEAALGGDPSEADRAFYSGKVASARWWAREVLPRTALRRRAAETVDLSLMDLDEAAF
jgi:alkylation response protein AidB-like acyl-CoA dehydrogenase